MATPYKIEEWHISAAQLMARTGCSLKDAVMELKMEVSIEDCTKLWKKPFFQRILWEERHRWHSELAKDPNLTKDALIGKLLVQAQKLEEEGSCDKAAEVVFKIAKMMGYVGPESTVSVFGELSQKDLDAIRESVSKKPKDRPSPN